MTSQREIAVVRPAEDWVSKDINLALRVHPFHTDSVTYSQRERSAYHNRSDCVYGRRIKRDGLSVPGRDERDLCGRCADLDAGVDDFFPGDEGA
jgi:hypothetical protein